MKTFDRIVGNTAGILAALSIVGFVTFLALFLYKPAGDRSDPDYHRYLETLDRVSVQLNQRGMEDAMDLSELNHGDWTTACLFGGYTRPAEKMGKLGANITENDQRRMSEASGFRLSPVEEFEVVIAYMDLSNNAHFIHFDTGIGPEGQHRESCVSKPQTRLVLVPS